MVRIINYKERHVENGTSFFVLEIQGGIEMIKSNNSGKYYASAKKATISSTFDETTCKALIGIEMEGEIVKIPCEPFNYTIKDTGESIELSHRYEYQSTKESITFEKEGKESTFSNSSEHSFEPAY